VQEVDFKARKIKPGLGAGQPGPLAKKNRVLTMEMLKAHWQSGLKKGPETATELVGTG
jgi:hypothetical protein